MQYAVEESGTLPKDSLSFFIIPQPEFLNQFSKGPWDRVSEWNKEGGITWIRSRFDG